MRYIIFLLIAGFVISNNEPEFLKSLPAKAKRDFIEISKNAGLSIKQKESKLSNWAKFNNISEKYDEWFDKIENRKIELRKNISEVISRLEEAKVKVDEIMDDKSMTKVQQQEAIKDVARSYSKEVSTLFYIGKLFSGKSKKD